MKLRFAIAFLAASLTVLAQLKQLPPPPPPFVDLKGISDTIKAYQEIWDIGARTARGSDPTQWQIAPKAVVPALRATPTPGESLDQLRVRLDRLKAQMAADGYRFNADALVCVVAECALDEERAAEIQDLGIAIAYTRREIDEIEQSPEIANRRYRAAMKALSVPAPQYEVNASKTTSRGSNPGVTPPAVQAKTLKNCSPVWESHTSWILTTKMVGFNRANVPQYVYQYQSVKYPVATYPAGCY